LIEEDRVVLDVHAVRVLHGCARVNALAIDGDEVLAVHVGVLDFRRVEELDARVLRHLGGHREREGSRHAGDDLLHRRQDACARFVEE
jgi:hypothetical protein